MFEKITTEDLIRETDARARDVDTVNDAVWAGLLPAFGWASAGITASIMALALLSNWPIAIGLIVASSVVAAYFGARPWLMACRACGKYADEMDARASELNRRASDIPRIENEIRERRNRRPR